MSIRTRVPVPIRGGIQTEMVSFYIAGQDGEDIALLFPGWEAADAPLVRVHSECLTGDVFASRRCDCGAQLDEAIRRMAADGGVLIYLRQEGRGIGLYNKLEAYRLQIEDGADTFAANVHLGLPIDSRDYGIAARMLQDLGVARVRLLTNNPDKVRGLEAAGIAVAEVIPTEVHTTEDNRSYLEAKKAHGHSLSGVAARDER